MNFTDYLIYTQSQLANLDQIRVVHVVLGNESSDLDSTISACVYAYFLYLSCLNKNEVLYLPIMNINSSTFRLRNEIPDINFSELYDQNKLQITLVDHHFLRSQFNEVVVEIIDHHPIKNDSILLKNSSAIKIEPVGSCCTLIAEKILASDFQMTEEIAYLLIGPIVFDTVNFSPTAGKTTEKDQQIYAQLQTFLQTPIDSSKLYFDLRESSCDITGYSIQDLLQKDAKQVVGPNLRLMMSSLPMNYTVEKLIREMKSINDFNEFLSENDGVIMTSIEVKNDESKRQLGFYMKNIAHIQPLNKYLQTNEFNLDLHEHCLPINQAQIKLFDQNNLQSSRKQILPFIEKFVFNFSK